MVNSEGYRVVYAGHGHARAMGYKYRVRIQEKRDYVRKYYFFGPKIERLRFRCVLDRYFIAWETKETGYWIEETKEQAKVRANRWLDEIEAKPSGKCV